MACALQACFDQTALLVRTRFDTTYSWNVHSKLGGNLLGTFYIAKDKDAYSLLRDLQDQVAKKLRHPTRLPRYLAFYASNVLITPKEWTYLHDFVGKYVSIQASLFVKHLSSTNDLQVMYDEDDQQAITDLSYVSKDPYDDETDLCVKLPAAPCCNTELDMRLLAFNTDESVTSMDLICDKGYYNYTIADLRVLVGYSSLVNLHIRNGLPTSWDFLRFLPNLKVLWLCSRQHFYFSSFLALDHQLTSLGSDITLEVEGYTICNDLPQAIKSVVFCQCELATQDQSFGACRKLKFDQCSNLRYSDVFSLALEELAVYRTRCPNNIPREIGRAVNLRKLCLCDSNLVGSIPTEIGRLTKLTYLRLAGNKLTSTIPSQVQNLCNLEVLDLSNNQLEGCIPTNLDRLTKLRELYINNNRLTGIVPSGLGCLAELDLKGNNFAS